MESFRGDPEGSALKARDVHPRVVAGATLCLVIAATGCARRPEPFQDSFLAMDSVVSLTLVTASADSARLGLAAAKREVARLEAILSDYRPDSNVGRLNRRDTDVLAPETRLLLERAQRVCHESQGAFDVTLRPVKALWGFGTGGTMHVPDAAAIRTLLPHVGCDTYAITPDGRLVWRDSLAQIDLGGIAQGFVGRCVADTLRALGLHDFLIDVSGDMTVGGHRAGGGPWRIGIQNPRRPDSLLAKVDLSVAAVTTSGDYEQFFEADGVRYHHIFDPATGYPARGVTSVTVFSDDPVAADCYTKVVFVLGPERGRAFLDARADLRGLIVTEPRPGQLRLLWSDGGPPGARP